MQFMNTIVFFKSNLPILTLPPGKAKKHSPGTGKSIRGALKSPVLKPELQ